MRKYLLLLIAFSLCLSMSACANGSLTGSGTPDDTSYISEDGATVRTTSSGTSVSAENLPCSIDHNSTTITVNSINVYRDLSSYNHSYTLYVVAEMDVSALDDTQIHWLRESDLYSAVYLTDEKNGYDFEPMNTLGSLLLEDTKQIYFVFTTSAFNENRYDFAEADFRLSFVFSQEETYMYNGAEKNKENRFSYSFTMPTNPPSAETIEEPLYSYIAEWLGNRADFYGSLLK